MHELQLSLLYNLIEHLISDLLKQTFFLVSSTVSPIQFQRIRVLVSLVTCLHIHTMEQTENIFEYTGEVIALAASCQFHEKALRKLAENKVISDETYVPVILNMHNERFQNESIHCINYVS